jgi:hypothetical protein
LAYIFDEGDFMQQMQSILAIFKDEGDAGSWAAYLDGIATLWSITGHDDLWQSVRRVKTLGIDPVVVIVSSRLYPTERPELAVRLKEHFPDAELLLLSSSEEPPLPLLQISADAVRHLEVNPPAGDAAGKGYFDCVLNKLIAGRPITVSDRLSSPKSVRTFDLRSSSDKETLLQTLEAAIAGEGDDFEIFRQRGALLADELMENALYGAPKDAAGEKFFRKGEARETLAGESLVFSFGFDGETLAMEMTDNWGTLDPDLVVEYLARNQAQLDGAEEMGGRGLFLIWRFFDHFHVSVYPGSKTVVGGDLQLSRGLDPEAPRGFHITEHRKGAAA